jgi:hypothetical protein
MNGCGTSGRLAFLWKLKSFSGKFAMTKSNLRSSLGRGIGQAH